METVTNGTAEGAETFEVEDDGREFHNPLGTPQHPKGARAGTPLTVRTTDVDSPASPAESPARSPGGRILRRNFRLSVTTDDPVLQPYFPNGPRKFPAGEETTSHASATSYDEINALVAKNLSIVEDQRIYIMCYRRDSDNTPVMLNPYLQDEESKLELFHAVPAAGQVYIALKRHSREGFSGSSRSLNDTAKAVAVMNAVAHAADQVYGAVDDVVEAGANVVRDTVSYGGEHHNKRRSGLYKIKCAGRRQREPTGWLMLHPLSPTRVLWDITQGFVVLYIFIFLPVTIAFSHADDLELHNTKSLLTTSVVIDKRFETIAGLDAGSKEIEFPSLDVVIDWLIVVDFFLQFRTAYALEHNDAPTNIVVSQKKICTYRIFGRAFNYIPSVSFCTSLITSIPFDRLMIPYYGHHGAYYFRAIKCLRVERIEHTMPFFEAFIERWTILIPALKPMASLLSAAILAVALCHIMSCLLYLSGHPMWEEPIWSETTELNEGGNSTTTLTMEGYVCDETDSCGWVAGAAWPAGTTRWERYMTAYYYSFTIMSTVGFGDLSAKNPTERFVTTWIMLVGVAMYAVLLGAITALIQSFNLGTAAFEENMAQMATYLRSRGVDHALRLRAREYFDFAYPQRVLFDEKTVLAMLPPKLRADVKLDMYRDVVEAIPFLPTEDDIGPNGSILDLEAIRLALAGILKPVTYMDREVIVHEGQRGHAMFIIVSGLVEVQVAGGEVLMQLGVCDCFGVKSCLESGHTWNTGVVSSGFASLAKIEHVELSW
jgi:hypothetical protein